MSLARLVVTAVRSERRTKSEVAREYGVSRRWVHELVRRYDAEGEAGLAPRSRRPHRSPNHTAAGLEDEIVELRKFLAERNRLRTDGTDNLLAAARETGVRRVVAQSFASPRYARQGGMVKTEDDP